jgi:hypothetical protein
MGYNVFFTGFPVMAAALEQDLPCAVLARHPALYADVAASDALLLSPRSLCAWLGRAAFQAALLIAVPACAFGGAYPYGSAAASDADQVRARGQPRSLRQRARRPRPRAELSAASALT